MSFIKGIIICEACSKKIDEVDETEVVIPSDPVLDEALRDLIKDIDIATAEMLDAEETFKRSKKVIRNLKKKLKSHQKI